MQSIASMTASDVISDAVLDEVFSEEDEIQKAKLLLMLEDKATELGVKSKFRAMVTAYKRVEKQMRTAAKSNTAASLDNWTNFEDPMTGCIAGHGLPGKTGCGCRIPEPWMYRPAIIRSCR